VGVGILVALIGFADACEPLDALVDTLHAEVLAAEPTRALAVFDRIEASLGCHPVQPPARLARIYTLTAIAHHLADDGEATAWFAAAHRTDPSWWDPAFPDDLRPQSLPLQRGASLTVEPMVSPHDLFVDGRVFGSPGPVPAGLHLVQVAAPTEPATMTRLVDISPDSALRLRSGLDAPTAVTVVSAPEPVSADPAESVRPRDAASTETSAFTEVAPTPPEPVSVDPVATGRSPRASLLWAGVGVGVASGTAAVLARTRDGAMRGSATESELNEAFEAQQTWARISYASLGAAGLLVGASFVF